MFQHVVTKVGNRIGTVRRYNLARLLLTLQRHQDGLHSLVVSHPEGTGIAIRMSDDFFFLGGGEGKGDRHAP